MRVSRLSRAVGEGDRSMFKLVSVRFIFGVIHLEVDSIEGLGQAKGIVVLKWEGPVEVWWTQQ